MPDDSRGYSVNNTALQDSLKQQEQAHDVVRRGDAQKRKEAQEAQSMQDSMKRAAQKAGADTKKVKGAADGIAAGIEQGHGEAGIEVAGNLIRGTGKKAVGGLDDGRTVRLLFCNNGVVERLNVVVR